MSDTEPQEANVPKASADSRHVLVIDAETDEVLIDKDVARGEVAENTDAVGTFTGPTVMHGPVYVGVKVWVDDKNTVQPWEEADDSVFLSYTDKSSTVAGKNTDGTLHTLERPLPGGAMGRFLVTVT